MLDIPAHSEPAEVWSAVAEPRDPEADVAEARGSLRRLAVALGLSLVLAFLCFVLAPRWGVYLPMAVPLMGFGAIALGTILAAAESSRGRKAPEPEIDPGRPMCCSGPRPVGEATRRSECCR